MFVKDGQPYSIGQLKKDHPNVSFPSPLTDEALASFGVERVHPTEKPQGDQVKEGKPVRRNGRWEQSWVVELYNNNQLKEIIARRRWKEENKGITVEGVEVKTDPASQARMLAATMRKNPKSRKWKSNKQFVTVSPGTMQSMADAVDDHVQACFDREQELVSAVDAGTFTRDMLDQGWPE